MPKDVNDGTRMVRAGSGVGQGKMSLYGGKDSKLNYQERVTEKVKSMGPCTLDGVEGRRGCAEDRVILVDMLNVGVFERMDKAASNPPIKVISSDIRTLGNGDSNRGRVVGVVRHTLGRKDSCRW